MNKEEIKKIYNDIISKYGFSPDFDFDDYDENELLQFSCRENGNLANDSFGMMDYQNAKIIMKELKAQYSIKIDIECVDEWVIISVEFN